MDEMQHKAAVKRFESLRDAELKTNPLTSPLTRSSDRHYIEGYWEFILSEPSERKILYPKGCSRYPMPRVSDTPVPKAFMDKLNLCIADVEPTLYLGSSYCRLCMCRNGCGEHSLTNKEGVTFVFPEGIFHYYEAHQVQPSPEFHSFVMAYDVKARDL